MDGHYLPVEPEALRGEGSKYHLPVFQPAMKMCESRISNSAYTNEEVAAYFRVKLRGGLVVEGAHDGKPTTVQYC